jgi:hypothetical protein
MALTHPPIATRASAHDRGSRPRGLRKTVVLRFQLVPGGQLCALRLSQSQTLAISCGECRDHQAGFAHLLRIDNVTGLQRFLELGADVETILWDFDYVYYEQKPRARPPSPLIVVASFDNVPMANILWDHGAHIVQYDGREFLSYRAIQAARSATMVQLLLDDQADPNQDDHPDINSACRPLSYYALGNDIVARRVALPNGAKVLSWGRFLLPLDEAVSCSDPAVVPLLMDNGANEAVKTPVGVSSCIWRLRLGGPTWSSYCSNVGLRACGRRTGRGTHRCI